MPELPDDVVYRSDVGTYHAWVDWTRDVPLSRCVTTIVASITDADTTTITPLHAVIDSEALDALFRPNADDPQRVQGYVSFTFEGVDVTIFGDGEIEFDLSDAAPGDFDASDDPGDSDDGRYGNERSDDRTG